MPFRTRTAVSGAVLATAAVLLGPAAAVARPAAAPAPPGWSAAPAPGDGAEPSAQDRPYFYLEGAPGTVLSDWLSLRNPTGHAVTVRLRGSAPGWWLSLASTEVKVPPHTRATVPFTVTVPRDAVPGDRSGVLIATGGGKGSGGGGRDAVPVHLRVTGQALSALTVEQVSVHGRDGAAVIRYTLVNRGNTALTPRLAVRADGLFGPVLRRAPRTLPTVLRPGQGVDLTEKWPDPPGLDAVAIRLTVTAGGGAHGSATATYTVAPWWAVAGGALLLAAGAGGLMAVRRRRRPRAAGPGPGASGVRGAGPAPRAAEEPRPPGGERADVAGQLAGSGSGARS
ncbi:COG1470 family protein [Streptomyces caniferus]|uniref:COG1470 family protein n=1 Tax=Streptomyces caniferus TaxID=285557 RepID=UPI0038094EEC